jgi:TrmH family RNA methyltransferase
VAKLAKKQRRQEARLFLVEGPQAIREALIHAPDLVEEVFATPEGMDRHPDIFALASREDIPVMVVSEAAISQMCDTVTPQGILAVCGFVDTPLEQVLATAPTNIAVLHRVQDPGNVGNIIRSADAAGASAIVVTAESVDVFNPKVVRATTGSLFHIPLVIGVELARVIDLVKGAGLAVFATDARGESLVDLHASGDLSKPTAWVFGNEAQGLTQEDAQLADRCVAIPLYGLAESLSVPTAAALCLYQTAFAQHTPAHPEAALGLVE